MARWAKVDNESLPFFLSCSKEKYRCLGSNTRSCRPSMKFLTKKPANFKPHTTPEVHKQHDTAPMDTLAQVEAFSYGTQTNIGPV